MDKELSSIWIHYSSWGQIAQYHLKLRDYIFADVSETEVNELLDYYLKSIKNVLHNHMRSAKKAEKLANSIVTELLVLKIIYDDIFHKKASEELLIRIAKVLAIFVDLQLSIAEKTECEYYVVANKISTSLDFLIKEFGEKILIDVFLNMDKVTCKNGRALSLVFTKFMQKPFPVKCENTLFLKYMLFCKKWMKIVEKKESENRIVYMFHKCIIPEDSLINKLPVHFIPRGAEKVDTQFLLRQVSEAELRNVLLKLDPDPNSQDESINIILEELTDYCIDLTESDTEKETEIIIDLTQNDSTDSSVPKWLTQLKVNAMANYNVDDDDISQNSDTDTSRLSEDELECTVLEMTRSTDRICALEHEQKSEKEQEINKGANKPVLRTYSKKKETESLMKGKMMPNKISCTEKIDKSALLEQWTEKAVHILDKSARINMPMPKSIAQKIIEEQDDESIINSPTSSYSKSELISDNLAYFNLNSGGKDEEKAVSESESISLNSIDDSSSIGSESMISDFFPDTNFEYDGFASDELDGDLTSSAVKRRKIDSLDKIEPQVDLQYLINLNNYHLSPQHLENFLNNCQSTLRAKQAAFNKLPMISAPSELRNKLSEQEQGTKLLKIYERNFVAPKKNLDFSFERSPLNSNTKTGLDKIQKIIKPPQKGMPWSSLKSLEGQDQEMPQIAKTLTQSNVIEKVKSFQSPTIPIRN